MTPKNCLSVCNKFLSHSLFQQLDEITISYWLDFLSQKSQFFEKSHFRARNFPIFASTRESRERRNICNANEDPRSRRSVPRYRCVWMGPRRHVPRFSARPSWTRDSAARARYFLSSCFWSTGMRKGGRVQKRGHAGSFPRAIHESVTLPVLGPIVAWRAPGNGRSRAIERSRDGPGIAWEGPRFMSSAKRDAIQILPALESEVAHIPGGRDREGRPLIVVSVPPGEPSPSAKSSLDSLLRYYSSIFR